MTFAATILSTKKLKPEWIDKATAHGIDIVEKIFIQTESIPFTYSGRNTADWFVFTSANAVKSVLAWGIELKGKKIAGTSGETKKVLNDQGLNISLEAHDAQSLAELLIKNGAQSVIFFCGILHREELSAALRAADIPLEEIAVYKTQFTPVALNQQFDGILFFSPSAVDSFFINNTISDKTICFCIGQTTASHLATKTKSPIQTASFPSQEKLIDQLINYYTHEVHVKK